MEHIIQIAGIKDEREARMLLSAGVSYLGFPIDPPVHRGDLSIDETERLIHTLEIELVSVAITYLGKADEILALCRQLGVRRVQLHGDVQTAEIAALRDLDPDLVICKGLIIHENNLNEMRTLIEQNAPHVDAFITDTFDPLSGATGATGLVHDWGISRRIVDLSPRPVILAGGLHVENIREAIITVRPSGVDAHTGVEVPDGRKDETLVRAFVEEVNNAFSIISAEERQAAML
jgi:phosphoribosylanthranilate isomerase